MIDSALTDAIIIRFTSYASIPFKTEIYADRLVIDWGNGNIQEYNNSYGYFNIRYTYPQEGQQQLIIYGSHITYVQATELCMNDLFLSRCPSLEYLNCSGNELNSLDISGCQQLEELYCNSNNLSHLDIPAPNHLFQLHISYNNLQELNLRHCPHLQSLNCSHNRLCSLLLPERSTINDINISENFLEETMIETVFRALPPKNPNDYALIRYRDNPGFGNCNTNIIRNKQWHD